MAKTQEVKDYVENRLAAVLGADFIGNIGGKLYVWGKDKSGERAQVALSLTCPKVPVDVVEQPSTGFDWTSTPATKPTETKKVEMTEDEKNNIASLLSSLGL